MATVRPDATANPAAGSRGYLKWYWTKGPGFAKWASSPTPFTTLKTHLIKYLPATYVNQVVAQWFHDALGFWPGTPHAGATPLPKLH